MQHTSASITEYLEENVVLSCRCDKSLVARAKNLDAAVENNAPVCSSYYRALGLGSWLPRSTALSGGQFTGREK